MLPNSSASLFCLLNAPLCDGLEAKTELLKVETFPGLRSQWKAWITPLSPVCILRVSPRSSSLVSIWVEVCDVVFVLAVCSFVYPLAEWYCDQRPGVCHINSRLRLIYLKFPALLDHSSGCDGEQAAVLISAWHVPQWVSSLLIWIEL